MVATLGQKIYNYLLSCHRERKLNEICDKDTKKAYKHCKVPPSPYLQDTAVVNVKIRDEVVIVGITDVLVQAAHTSPMIKYLMEKY